MKKRSGPGLGELLRHVSDLVDRGAEAHYRDIRLNYRPRYTPVLRAIDGGAQTVSEITERMHLTQGAVSQTVALMLDDGLVTRREMAGDARKTGIQLTPKGRGLLAKLRAHWAITFAAIEALEREIGHPLREVLAATAAALERSGFDARLTAARQAAEAAAHV